MQGSDTAYGLINLQALVDSIMVEFEGDQGLFIPFRPNPSIVVSDRGVHLNVKIHPMRGGRDNHGNTQVCYAAPRKELKDVLSEEDKKTLLPYLGKFYISSVKSSDEIPRTRSGVPIVKRIDSVPYHNPQNAEEYDGLPF